MLLDLKRLSEDVTQEARRFPPEALDTSGDDFRVRGEIGLQFEVRRKGQEYWLRGQLQVPLELVCGRCLEPLPWNVDVGFDLRYRPQADNAGEGEREIDEQDLSLAYYQGDVIDMGQLVREQCYLAMPMKPLCSPSCRGLCPRCGTNLNTGSCSCGSEWEDPRLAPLRAWLDRRETH